MFCHNCGYQIQDEAAFCPKCGTKLPPLAPTPPPEPVPVPVPEPVPAPASETIPVPEAVPAPASGTVPVPEAAPTPVSGTIPVPEAAPAPVLGTIPVPETAPAPVSGTIPVPGTTPAPASGTIPVPEAAPAPVSGTIPVPGMVSAPPPVSPPPAAPNPPAVPQKKGKKWPLLIVLLLLIAGGVYAALNWNGKIDYIGTVKAHQPFLSQGFSLTYGEVLDTCLTSPVWTVREEGDTHYVDITGDNKGSSICTLTVTIAVRPDSADPDIVQISPISVTIDGGDASDQNDAVKILLAMFSAKAEGQEDLGAVMTAITGQYSSAIMELVNEEEGFSLSYPDTLWKPVDLATLPAEDQENTVAFLSGEIPYAPDFSSGIQILKFPNRPDQIAHLYIDDTEFAATWDNDAAIIETALIELGGVTMRKVVYSEPSDGPDDFFWSSYLYAAGSDLYRVNFVRKGTLTQALDHSFDELMKTYTVTADLSVPTAVQYPGEVVYKGLPVSTFLYEYVDNVIADWGTPADYNYGNGYNFCIYDGIEFAFDYEGLIYNIQMDADACTFDGVTMARNRDAIIDLLGSPAEEGWTTDYDTLSGVESEAYGMTFYRFSSGTGIRVVFADPNSSAYRVSIWSTN
ncbi:MAG: zinc-ribbon domain-containing protein [Oscillospiraceae bacterium]|nr:zinc-ribbon domain-containing protein [Oscillospiraceae bacterium]